MRPSHPVTSGGVFFITQVTWHRERMFTDPDCAELLLSTLRRVKERHAYEMRAWVITPDHFHLMIRPGSGEEITLIMRATKAIFTQELRRMRAIPGKIMVWQSGFMDHKIRNDEDYRRHIDYIHYNPVADGLVQRPEAYGLSSFAAWKARGAYEEKWGWSLAEVFGDWKPAGLE
jgi:putative transposase